MTPWIIAGALYLIGLIGLHQLMEDLQEAPVRTLRAWAGLLLWPVVIPLAKLGDLYETLRGER